MEMPLNMCFQLFRVGPSILVWRHRFGYSVRHCELSWRYVNFQFDNWDITVQWL
jgi:hypothetical protein